MPHMHYFPLDVGVATLFFAILLGLLVFIQLRLLGHAYSALGLDPRVAMLVLLASLLGSYVNLPLARLPEQRVVSLIKAAPVSDYTNPTVRTGVNPEIETVKVSTLALERELQVGKRRVGKYPRVFREKAVERMLPRGPLGRVQLGNLRVYKGPEHPHAAQKPVALAVA